MSHNEKVQKLREFFAENGIEAKFYEFSESTLSVDESAEQLDVEPNRIVKSLVFKDSQGDPVLAIVPGDRRVDESKLSKAHGREVEMAKAREVEEFTGYKIGEVPPVCSELETYMDSDIAEFDSVVAGGGSTHTLVELDPEDIIRVTKADLANIS